jgi:hypothetical protein
MSHLKVRPTTLAHRHGPKRDSSGVERPQNDIVETVSTVRSPRLRTERGAPATTREHKIRTLRTHHSGCGTRNSKKRQSGDWRSQGVRPFADGLPRRPSGPGCQAREKRDSSGVERPQNDIVETVSTVRSPRSRTERGAPATTRKCKIRTLRGKRSECPSFVRINGTRKSKESESGDWRSQDLPSRVQAPAKRDSSGMKPSE